MKPNITFLFLGLAITLTVITGCKKDSEKNKPDSSSFFVEGRGLRKIHEVNHPSSGNISGFGSSTMMLDGENLDWIFAWYSSANFALGYEPYRRRINIRTGDTLANPGVPPNNPVQWLVSPADYYRYANGTNKLCWISGNSLVGEPEGLPLPYFVQGKVYDKGQLFSYNATSAYIGAANGKHLKPVIANFRRNGAWVDTGYQIGNYVGKEMIRCMDMEMNPAGEILMFAATGDSIQVRRFSDNVVIAGIPSAALAADYPDYSTSPYCYFTTRRSADGSTITGFINNYHAFPQESTTFVYNTSTNTIQLKLNAASRTSRGSILGTDIVFDDAGNVYYVDNPKYVVGEDAGGITKQTPAGNSILAERFFTGTSGSLSINRIYAIGAKLFVLLHKGQNSNATASNNMTTYLLTVAE